MEISYQATSFEAVRAICRLTGELSLQVGEKKAGKFGMRRKSP
jgi:hypothetical protein